MLIKEGNREKIEAAIREVEGRATARTVTYGEIAIAIAELEKTLNICKKDMMGIIADIDYHAQNFPNAYKYTPESTHIKITRKNSAWDLVRVYRDTTRREGHRYHLTLTEDAKKAIIKSKEIF